MKHLITLLFLTQYFFAGAQKTEVFYDYYWKPCEPGDARYYSTVQMTDSGWLRHDYFITGPTIQMKALYADKDCKVQNGEAMYFYANGQLQARGRLINNKKEGMYLRYHSNGMMSDSAIYNKDVVVGSRIMWHNNGYMSDSIYHVNDSMDIHVNWFDSGELAGAGFVVNGKLNGKWKYYHYNGSVAGEAVYKDGKVITRQYFNEDGTSQPDTAKANRPAGLKKGGVDGWKKYLEKNLYWPHQLRLANTTHVTLGVAFSVSAEGKIDHVEVTVPFHQEFDQIAIKTIKNSPEWNPDIRHNRKVRSWFRQSVTFQQQE